MACCFLDQRGYIQFPLMLAQISKLKLFLNLLVNFVAIPNTKDTILSNYFLQVKPHILFNVEALWKQAKCFATLLKNLLSSWSVAAYSWWQNSELVSLWHSQIEQNSDMKKLLHTALPSRLQNFQDYCLLLLTENTLTATLPCAASSLSVSLYCTLWVAGKKKHRKHFT